MQYLNSTEQSLDNFPMDELSFDQLDQVAGGIQVAEWGVSTGVATAFVVGAATVAAPVIAGAFAVGAIGAAGFAIYYAVSDEDEQTQ